MSDISAEPLLEKDAPLHPGYPSIRQLKKRSTLCNAFGCLPPISVSDQSPLDYCNTDSSTVVTALDLCHNQFDSTNGACGFGQTTSSSKECVQTDANQLLSNLHGSPLSIGLHTTIDLCQGFPLCLSHVSNDRPLDSAPPINILAESPVHYQNTDSINDGGHSGQSSTCSTDFIHTNVSHFMSTLLLSQHRFRRHASNDVCQQSTLDSLATFDHQPSSSRLLAPRRSPGISSVYVDVGDCDQICEYCNAQFWYEERLRGHTKDKKVQYNQCCAAGKVALLLEKEPPLYIKELYKNKKLLANIRAYNQMFSMTSLGANVDETVNNGRGPYVFKVSGQIYHWIGTLCPIKRDPPLFLQLYIHDTQNEVDNRMHHFGGRASQTLDYQIVEGHIRCLDEHNDLVKLFPTARDKCNDHDIPTFKIRLYSMTGLRQYELPTSQTVGAIVFENAHTNQNDYDVVIEMKDRSPQRINNLHQFYMSLQFPLLFIYGKPGFHTSLKLRRPTASDSSRDRRLIMSMYYSYVLHDRFNMYGLLLRGGRLFQQYVVTAYCNIEMNMLDYIRDKQSDIRNEYLSGLHDAVTRGDRDGSDVGRRTILPASFTGGPRYLYSHYLDALAICRVHGNPQFFITFTCNVNWPEIKRYMAAFPELSPSDRPDIVDRLFHMKVHQLIKVLKDNKPFGQVAAVLYTIKFQKRGLPYCHTLLWVKNSDRIRAPGDVDCYISAELPDPKIDPDGYNIVSEMMMHGPCGLANPNAVCMQDGVCSKHFPKKYHDNTFFDDNGYVHYRRRNTHIHTTRQRVDLDNSYVVPYNHFLCRLLHAHINVEYCGWSMLIKYLFKYISKGTDRVFACITRPIGHVSTSRNQSDVQIDEIKNFVDARYICPHEACWRILNFDIHSREPSVQLLVVHLENMQQMTFRSSQPLQQIVDDPVRNKTTLTEWLSFNAHSEEGSHLTYLSFPSEFVWYATGKYWKLQANRNKSSVGRLAYIHPNVGELFYLRMLLCHRKGCKSFECIHTIENHVYTTYRAACEALGLLGDDREWNTALQEASISATPAELRTLFAHILLFCNVTDPITLWKQQWQQMTDDIPMRMATLLHIPNLHVNSLNLEAYTLFELEAILNASSKSVKDFGLPLPPQHLLDELKNRLLMEEKNYDRECLMRERDISIPMLNVDQKTIYDLIIKASQTNEQKLLFVYGHGGMGKTFLWKAIINTLRSEGKIVLVVASSGIASLLLPCGRTAHSRFKLPIDLTDESMCNVKKKTHMADLLNQTTLIIWDEASMNDRRCFEALDRTLRDILNKPDNLFGGKSVMLGGNFIQTLPVKKTSSMAEIMSSSIAESHLWSHFHICTLKENMRLSQPKLSVTEQATIQNFSSWLLDVCNILAC